MHINGHEIYKKKQDNHASPIYPGPACIDYHTNRSDRTSKDSAYHSWRARATLVYFTVVEIVTVNVCVWNNRKYTKHNPDPLYNET